MTATGRLAAALAGVVVFLGAAGAAGASVDPAVEALRGGDAYVSPRVLGPASASEQRRLADSAAALREAGRPVKLAVVFGPVGAPSLKAYADRLSARLGHDGTLVVTVPDGRVAAATSAPGIGPAAPLRAAGLASVPNPVERLVRAARIAAGPVERDDPGPEAALVLVGIAVLGGGWAAALGLGRAGRDSRRRLGEARALLRLDLDALRARASALARRDDLTPAARGRVERALGAYAGMLPALQAAGSREEVTALAPRVRDALRDLAEVAEGAGVPFAAERPFDGLCTADPGHGPAAAEGPVTGRDGDSPVCTACREAADSGRPPARRMLPRDGRPVPFDEAAEEGVRASRA